MTGVISDVCLVRDVLDRVGDKWSVTVLYQLFGGRKRFMELRRDIPGVSQRMLTVTLRQLERDGLVRRTVHPVVPPHVDYELTPLAMTLEPLICGLIAWAERNWPAVQHARHSYDTAAS